MRNLKSIFGLLTFLTFYSYGTKDTMIIQTGASTDRVPKHDHTIKSTVNGKFYQLFVSLPGNYNPTDSLRYPVLYSLDGKYWFSIYQGARFIMDLGKELDDVILVGISDSTSNLKKWAAGRDMDYTPSRSIEESAIDSVKTGRGFSFLSTIKNEIIPFVEKHYKTTNDRGLAGMSFGGLFVTYSLLTAPDLFNKYGINSPSLWYNKRELLQLEKAFARNHKSLNATVFISVGGLEDSDMLPVITEFTDSLRSRHYKGLKLTYQIFDNESHLSVVPANTSRTLRELYGSKRK